MNNEKTILEQFREREKEIKKECDRLDVEMDKKRRESERVQRAALDKLTAARANLDRMKSEYRELTSELEGQARAEIEATAITAEKVGRGEASIREYFAGGLSGNAIAVKAHDDAAGKLADAIKLIRAKAAEIFQLEFEEAEARMNVIYCATYPGQSQIVRLKEEIKTLEQGVSAVLYGYPKAGADRDAAKNSVSLCQEKSMGSLIWDSLSYDELCDLRLDPRITNIERFKALDGLEGIIASAKPGKRYYLAMSFSGWGREPGFIVRCLDEGEGRMITTSTTSAPVVKK